ncbi:MAG: hypothetical protein AAFX85_15800, partial [Pseudomonadota bacterium]
MPAPRDRIMMVATDEGAALLTAGRAHLLAFELDQAAAQFERLAELEPGGPAAYHHLATIALWRGLVTEDARHFDAFFDWSDRTEAALDDAAASPWRGLIAAERELSRATAHLKLAQYTRAALAGRAAFRGFERLVRDHPDFHDAYKGLGLCHVAVDIQQRHRPQYVVKQLKPASQEQTFLTVARRLFDTESKTL